jgi:hypothetical protein
MSRLGLGLGLIKGGGIRGLPFNPLSYDPSIYFNADDSMLSAMQNPTLDLDPSVPSSLDIITATRAGTATVTDASGNIVDAAPNTVRVDHVQGELITAARTNLMGYSEPTLAQYSSGSGSGISEVVVADSGLTQWTQWDDTTGLTRDVTKSGFPFVVGQPYILSFYIRMNDGGIPVVGNSSSGASTDFAILIQGDSYAGTGYNGGIENVGSGLYRVWGKKTATTTLGNFHISKYSNQSARGFRVSGLQVEQATAPTALIDNDTGGQITEPAVYGPRVPMILVEPSATNLLPYSEYFGSGWSVDDVSLTGGNPSPDGSDAATLLKGNTNASRHNVVKFGVTNTVTGSFSLFAKAKELRYLQIASQNTASQYANFDLLSGTIGSVASDFSNAKLESYPDGWYRITLVSPNKYNSYYISLVSGLTAVWLESWAMPNDTDGLYIWGAQLEESSVATSYIPTSGSTVTRNDDVYKIEGDEFQTRGPNVVVNGGFDTDTNWVKDAAASIAGGVLTLSGSSGLTRQAFTLNATSLYRVSYKVSNYVSGSPRPYLNGATGPAVSANGSYVHIMQPTGVNNFLGFNPVGATMDIDNFVVEEITGGLWNTSEGTIYVEFVPKEVTTVTFIYEASDTSNERIYSRVGSSDSLKVSDGETQASITAGTASLVMLNRLAASFKQNNFQVAVNGTAGTPDISGSLPSVTVINIGSNFAGDSQLNGHIKRMIYWPYHSDSL